MKVALVAEWLDAWRGGAETSTLQFMHHLMDAGVEIHLFTRSRPSPIPRTHVHTISGARMSRTRRSVTFARRVERRLEADSFDIIHAISPCRGADIYQPRGGTIAETVERNLALRKPGAARSLKRCANHFNLKQRYMLALERQLLGNGGGPMVVAISDYVTRQLKRHYALADERIHKIFNGVNPDPATDDERARNRAEVRKTYDVGDGDLLVLLVAHNFRLKGVACWMEALAGLERAGAGGVRTLVVGKGESVRWHRLADRLGVASKLTFVGPSERTQAFRHAADVFVHPTYYDPCSRVVLEAMAAGLPTITTQWDGAAEMITDGESGFVLSDPDDIAALMDRVNQLRDPARRVAIGTAARKAMAHGTMARHTSQMLELYESLAGSHRKAGGTL
ncbi:MAG: glycosyltransferase family 4 protein [Planctomycetes bacterium]|nr:glycosyltransferase family 4 protein [Planctomycetota bacterium]